jgi:hypothetical protein
LILAAALGLSAAGAQQFSHRLHLKLGVECTNCHASAATSTKVSDNNLPDKSACLRCHKDVRINKPPVTNLAKFSHRQHLEMGSIAPVIAAAIDSKTYLSNPDDIRRHLNTKNACVACHRGLEESDAVTKAALPQMADCLVCHSNIDPPFSCETCHEPGASLKPASHTPDYIDIHSSGKANLDKASCIICHGKRFTCLGCH